MESGEQDYVYCTNNLYVRNNTDFFMQNLQVLHVYFQENVKAADKGDESVFEKSIVNEIMD